jgi:hypothetical protein
VLGSRCWFFLFASVTPPGFPPRIGRGRLTPGNVGPGQVDTGGVVAITPSRVHRVSVAVIAGDVLDWFSSRVRGHRSRLNSEERGFHVYQEKTSGERGKVEA